MTTLAKIDFITRTFERSLSTLAARPDVQREIDYYRQGIEKVKSIDDFVKDDRTFKFAMTAFGLGDFAYAKAFIRRALSEGVDAPAAFANQLTDGRYREFVETFNFHRYGEAATIFDRARQGTIDRYTRQLLEEQEGAQDANVRLALYFQRKSASIDGPFDILSDRALTQFMYTALGLPAATSVMNIDRQADLLQSRIDFSKLKSPEGVARLVTRFAAVADASAPASSTSALQILGGQSTSGIGVDLMLVLQRTRLGGL